jgi:hypothetical protein
MQAAQQAQEDAEKRARDSQGLLEAANQAITELQAANVRTVYGEIVICVCFVLCCRCIELYR